MRLASGDSHNGLITRDNHELITMTHRTFVSFSLGIEADQDILRWLDHQDNRSAAIREALREHLDRNSVTLGDVYRAITKLERKIETGVAIVADGASPAEDDWDEPAEAARNLDGLLNRLEKW